MNVTLTLPVASRERVLSRALEAQQQHPERRLPARIVIGPGDYAKLLLEMRRYGFHNGKPLQVLYVPIVCDDKEETAPEFRTVRFEWSE